LPVYQANSAEIANLTLKFPFGVIVQNMSDDAELLNIFWIEVGEYLRTLNDTLLKVETGTASDLPALLREMNRLAHSMKGAARAVGIGVIETIAHYMEEVFNATLEDKMKLTPEVCDLLYDGLDLIQNVVNGEENPTDALAEVLGRLEQIVVTVVPDTKEVPSTPPPKKTTAIPIVGSLDLGGEGPSTLLVRSAEETIRVGLHKLDTLMAEASELLIAKMHGEERQREINRLRKLHTRWQREWRSVRAAYIRLARRLQNDENADELLALFKFLETNQQYLSETNRELAQLAQATAQDNMRLSLLADQLQDDIGGMRLVPFDSVVSSMQRLVRDLARDTNKQITLDIIGASVELDKTVLDVLKEPIMHLLRNAADHGLELPEERERKGKSPVGRLELALEQRGNEIIVRVSDDGHGIDLGRIRRAAIKAGLISTQEAAILSEDDVQSFMFHPGLSTAQEVTALSGRGVGMDVVRERVKNLRGRVAVESVLGHGTTISLIVPVSLTRIRCILLQAGDSRFAVPSSVVLRMVTIKRSDIFTAEGREMVTINEQPLPLVSLDALLDVPHEEAKDEAAILVLRATDRTVAFEVDGLLSEQELVLKSLGPEIERARYVSGAALLGTGDVIIVLDAHDLIRGVSGVRFVPRRAAVKSSAVAVQQRMRVLVVDDSITTRTLEKNILETAGFEVQVAINGAEAWEILAENDFDVVICDVEMPTMNGLELTQRIRESTRTQHLPVILLTSLSKPEQREAGLRAGADAYLIKSQFEQDELLRTIQAVI
jgi:two-component system, chemotaxis family, sensor kinase CheA